MKAIWTICSFFFLAVGVRPAGSADCNNWNTREFFGAATIKNVTDCLGSGSNPMERDGGDISPLHWAAGYSGTPGIITALLKAGADLSVQSKGGFTPLHWAAGHSEIPEIITALLKGGADPNAQSDRGYTALDWWTENNNDRPSVLSALLEAEIDSVTSLHRAVLDANNPGVIYALIKTGSDPNACNTYGTTPLHWAAKVNQNPGYIRVFQRTFYSVYRGRFQGFTLYGIGPESAPGYRGLRHTDKSGRQRHRAF